MAEEDDSRDEQAEGREAEDERLLAQLGATRAPGKEDAAAERDAIAKLIGSYDGYLARVLATKVFDRNERDDVAQGVRLRLARTLARTNHFDVPFFAIVRRSLKNELIDYYRRRARQRRQEEAGEITMSSVADPPEDPSERIDIIGEQWLRDALAKLPAGERDLLGAKLLLGFTGAELAERFGISENNANVRLHRALKKLRDLLGGDVSEPGEPTE